MSRKKKRKHRRVPAKGTPNSNTPPPKRRLPAPQTVSSRRQNIQKPRRQLYAPEDNPYVQKIVSLIQQVSSVSKLSPHVILSDWVGMMEASLRMWAENMKAMATTGKFIEDPPEIKEIYTRARARYTHASARYPAVYRLMQEIFPQTFALLMESAASGLEAYGQQTELSPDVIGQVFVACLGYPVAWLDFFPAWGECLVTAQEAISDGDELVYTALAKAALRARCDGHQVELQPGRNFETWFETILPYYNTEPVIIGPPLITSGSMLLALASRFPDWTLKNNLVQFSWGDNFADSLLEKMVNFNAMIFGLNGYLLEHVEAIADIQAHYQQPAEQDQPVPSRGSPRQVYRITQPEAEAQEATPVPPPVSQQSIKPSDPKSFSDLFKR